MRTRGDIIIYAVSVLGTLSVSLCLSFQLTQKAGCMNHDGSRDRILMKRARKNSMSIFVKKIDKFRGDEVSQSREERELIPSCERLRLSSPSQNPYS